VSSRAPAQARLHRHWRKVCLPHLSASHHAPEGSHAAMTDSTATKAASNGDTTTEKHQPAQREHGMNRLREQECYQLTSLISDGLDEAEHLIRKVHNKAYNRVLDYDGSKGTQSLDRQEALKILDEAYQCASLALTYICNIRQDMREDLYESEPPF
jgi:hypothetical protein